MTVLAEMREELIQQIRQAFPKNPPAKVRTGQKLAHRNALSERSLREHLEGKLWEEVASNSVMLHIFSDVDYLDAITDESFLYYLPAFLVAMLHHPFAEVYHSLHVVRISNLMHRFSLKQVEALVAYLDYQYWFWRTDQREDVIKVIERLRKQFISRRDEMLSRK